MRSSPGNGFSTPPLKKYVTCAYFSVSATRRFLNSSSVKTLARMCSSFSGPEHVAQPRPGFFVLGHADERQIFRARGIGELVEAGFDKRFGDLAGAVGAEIKEDHGIVIANQAARHGRFARRGLGGDHCGEHEFIGHTFS